MKRARWAGGLVSLAVIIGSLGIWAAEPAAASAGPAVGSLVPPADVATAGSAQAVPCLPVVGCDPAGSLAGDAAEVAAQGMLDASARWIAAGATTLLSRVTQIMSQTTSIDLESPHGAANWFSEQFAWMRTLAGFVILPMVLVAAISAVVHQDPTRLLRAVGVDLPLAVVGTAVAIELTNRALQLTDLLSNQVSASLGGNVQQSLDAVIKAMDGLAGAGSAAGGFVLMIGTLLVAFGALLVWIELLVRASAISVAVLFLPLALSGLLWPATARWARRMVEVLVALILSKFVIVAVISLAGGALASGDGLDSVLAGAALLLMAGFAPFALLRLVPIAEAGVIGHFEGLERRPVSAAGAAATRAAGTVGSGGGFTAGAAGFSSESGLAPALGTVLPDPTASSFAHSFTDLGGGDAGLGSSGDGLAQFEERSLEGGHPDRPGPDSFGVDPIDGRGVAGQGWDDDEAFVPGADR